ncbi:histidinol-phosphate transaminase [Kallotenue papyrolyticum]|uniref:histidinol-phosphate transaminase n=1 Tax=Kallotenue papyrolyticum TaxID=1325125 RepID=UPI0004BCC960
MEIEALIRPDLAALEPYTPIVPFEALSARLGLPVERIIKLDANENPYGPAPGVREALARYPFYAIYPDPDQTELRAAISGYIGQPTERIICGNGSDEIIDLLMRLFVAPGEAVVEAPPTFGMYSFNTGVVGGRLVQVPRDEAFGVDVEAIAAAVEASRAKLIFLPSPNNPDGSLLPRAAVERLLELPAVLVVDEAYAEFSGQSVADLVGQAPNLVVLRTFSKWAGLAGLRIGYGLVPEPIIRHLWKIKPPYNINMAAHVAALASLAAVDELLANVRRIIAERERVFAALAAMPQVRVYPSAANFLLVRLRNGDGRAVKQALEQRGILIRHYNKPGLQDCIRISIGTPTHNDALLEALSDLLQN